MVKFKLSDFDAVAFDLEGTLADTIPTHHRARIAAFEQHGFGHITKQQHDLGPTYGSSSADIMGGILHAAGDIENNVPFAQNQTVLDLIATKGALFKAESAAGFSEMPDAVDFVHRIAPYFTERMSIVTSSDEEFIQPFLARYGLARYFPDDLIIGRETVANQGLEGKPSGDPYLLAARRLDAKHLLVFEDTVSGVASGKRAGTTVIALTFDKQNGLLFKRGGLEYPPDAVVDNFNQAASILGMEE